MKIKAVIFDFDDTLEDFAPAEASAEAYLAKAIKKHFGIPHREFLKIFNDIKVKRIHKRNQSEEYSRILWITEALARLGTEFDYDTVDSIVEEYWNVIMKEAKLFPNTRKVLRRLKKDYKLAMISDGDGHKQIKMKRLKRMRVMDYFDAVITSDDIGYDKPDRKLFLLACEMLKVKPEQCVMVGDAPHRDLKTSKKLGMTTVWTQECLRRDTSPSYADYTISEIGQLIGVMKEIS